MIFWMLTVSLSYIISFNPPYNPVRWALSLSKSHEEADLGRSSSGPKVTESQVEGPELKPRQTDFGPVLLLIHCSSLYGQQSPELNPCVSHSSINLLNHCTSLFIGFYERFLLLLLHKVSFKSTPISSLILLTYSQKKTDLAWKGFEQKDSFISPGV